MTSRFVRPAVTIVLLVCLVTTPVANTIAVAGTPQSESITLENTMLGGESTASTANSTAIKAAPAPSLSVNSPREATVGESFDITVVAENDGGDAGEYSTISLSSPTLGSSSRAREITGVSSTLPYDAFIEPGEAIYTKGGESTEATATLVESSVGSGGTWGAGNREQMTVEVTPTESGTYTFYVRTTLTDPADTDVKYTAPQYGDAVDQQGYDVREITVEVTDESEQNQAPTIDEAMPDGAVTTAPGEESDTFEIDASDPDGDDLTYTWLWWDDGDRVETFDDLGSDATFYWDQPGEYRIEVVVSDGEATTSHSWPFVIEEETTEYDLTVDATDGGEVGVDPPGVTTTDFDQTYADGEVVELTAEPDNGYTFSEWEGDVSWSQADEQTIEVTMDEARSVTATFEREENHAPEISRVDPNGEVTTVPGEVSDEFSVTATDPDGDDLTYTWIWWEDGDRVETFDDLGSEAEFSWDQPGDYRIEVVVSDGDASTSHSWPFVIEEETTEYELAVDATAGGEVSIDPPGVTTSDLEQSYPDGEVVELTAERDDGYTFAGWEGDVSWSQEDEQTIEVTMDDAQSVTATFEAETNSAPEITRAEPDGEVVTAPGEIADSFSVTASDPDGDDLTYTWIWWEDGNRVETFDDLGPDAEFHWDQPGDYRIEVVVSDGKATTSHSWPFIIEEQTTEYTLAVDAANGGVVEVTPPGVTTSEFEQAYADGQTVELTANPEDGYTFSRWEGDVSWSQEDEQTIEVTMDEGRSMTATFEASENQVPEITRADPDGEVVTAPGETSDELAVTATDPDGDDLTYTWIWWEDGDRVETFDDLGSEAEFSWDQPGEYRIEVVVSDGDASTSHSWPFVIEEADSTIAVKAEDVAVVGPQQATVTGELSDLGSASQADVYVEYRELGASTWDRTRADTFAEPGVVDWELDGLEPDTDYEVRVVVETDTDRKTTRELSFTTDVEEQTATSGRIVHTSLPEKYRENQVVWAYVRIQNPDPSTQTYSVGLADDTELSFPRVSTREIKVPGNAIGLVKIPVRLTGTEDSTTVDVHMSDASGKRLDTMSVRLSKIEDPSVRERFISANKRLVAAIDTQCWTLSEGCESIVQREAAYFQHLASFGYMGPAAWVYIKERRRNMIDADEQAARREGILDGVSAAGVKTKEEALGTVDAAKQFADSPVGFVVETAGNTKRAVAVAAEHPELVTKAMERAVKEKRDEIRAQSPYKVGTEEFEEYRAAWVQYYVGSRIAIMVAAGKGSGKVATKVKQGTKLGKSSIVGRIDANERLSGIYLRLYGDGYSMDRIQRFKTRATAFVARNSLDWGDMGHVLDSISYVRERTGYTPKKIGDVAEAIYLRRVAAMTGAKLVKSADDIPRDEPGTYLLHSVRVGPEGNQAGELDVVQVEVTEAGTGTELRVTKVYEVTHGQSTAASNKYFGGPGPDDAVKTKNSQLLTTLQDAKTGDYEIAKGLDARAFQHDDGVGSVIVGPSRWSGDSTLSKGEDRWWVESEGPGRVGFGASLPYTTSQFEDIDGLIEKSDFFDGYDSKGRIVLRTVDERGIGHAAVNRLTRPAVVDRGVLFPSLRSRSLLATTNGTVVPR
ncbi:PKD domain-containing protein [Halorubellus sp. PRR65]|uniref:InlB B-repeat-containing protein n=1 Tax=Halorubellus sp. PRR65 TaxID=3098148 RepID=UPI002B25EFBB|nr:PKD domain-containing protein [Halorubellus sp. PRR65]